MTTEQGWSTGDEIYFLKRLGDWSKLRPAQTNRRRLDLYKKYLRSMSNRSTWGDVNPEMVRQFVLNRIGELSHRIQAYPHIP